MDFNNQWIEIFAPGDYGAKGKYGAAELNAMVRNFKAGVWTPPAVIGHPETAAPAHAWVKDMRVNERGHLAAQFEKETPQLVALAKEGRFPNRSVAIYTNPKFDGPAVRHIGFLGATPPEVKGLAPIAFSDGEFVAIEFDEREEQMDPKEIKKTVMENIREFFAELGGKKPDVTLSEEAMTAKIAAMRTEMEGKMAEVVEGIQAKFAEGAKKVTDAAAAGAKTSALDKVKAFIAARMAANQWVPAFAEAKLDRVLEVLATGQAVTFSEGEGEKKKDVTFGEAEAYTALTAFLEALPTIVPLKNMTKAVKRAAGNVLQFNETAHLQVDEGSVALNARAEEIFAELRKQDPKLSESAAFSEALRRARAESSGGTAAPAGGIAVGKV